MKSPVIWIGGKRRNIPAYAPYLPRQYGGYYEPFAGGAALFFHLAPPHGLLSDSNPYLMQFYRALRADPEGVIQQWEDHFARHSQTYYLAQRTRDPVALDLTTQAAWFLYLLRCSYNGLWRVNQSGVFNGPPGNKRYIAPDDLRAAAVALRRADLVTGDWRDVMGLGAMAGDFIFLDPPYAPISATSNFTGYTRDGWTTTDDRFLHLKIHELTMRGVHVMLASSDVEHIRTLYGQPPYQIVTLQTQRLIAPRSAQRRAVNELLILNYDEAVYGNHRTLAHDDPADVGAARHAPPGGAASRGYGAAISSVGGGVG